MSDASVLDDALKKVAKGAGIVFVGVAIGQAIAYFSRIFIARYLGPAPYGLVSLALAGLGIGATLALLGLPTGIVRYVSFYKGRGDKRRIKGTLVSSFQIAFPLSLVFGALLFLSSNWLSINVFQEPHLAPILRVFSLAVPFYVMMELFLAGIRGFQEMRYQVGCKNLIEPLSRIALVAALLFLGYGVLGAAVAYVLAIILASGFAFYLLERKIFPVIKTKIKVISMRKELFQYSWPLALVGILYLITSWTDTLMLGFFKTSTEVGFYNAALPTVQVLSVVPLAFGMIFFPVVSELYGREKIKEMKDIYKTVTKWIFLILFPLLLLMIFFSGAILNVMFGPTYVIASTALSILVVGFFVSYLFQPGSIILSTLKRTKLIFLSSLVTASLNVVLNYLLIPPYGIEGAAVATSLSVLSGGLSIGVFAYRLLGFQPFKQAHFKSLIAGLVAILLTFSIYEGVSAFIGKTIHILIGAFLVFVGLYFLMLLVLRCFDRNDIMIIEAIERKMKILRPLRKVIKRFL